MSIPNVRELLIRYWRPLTLYGGLFVLLAGLLAMRLNTLLPGFSDTALNSYNASLSLQHILKDPLNAPFLLIAHGVAALHTHHSLLLLRGVTAGLSLGTLVVFCVLLRHWHDARTALLGTLLLGTSSWFLLTARSGTPMILMLGLFTLIACGVWLRATGSGWAVLIGLVLAAVLIYIPGMIWLLGLGLLWQWKAIDQAFKKHLGMVTLAGLLFVAILAPLGWALYQSPELIKPLLNFPDHGWPMPFTVLRNLLEVPLHVFVHGQPDAATPIGQLPLLDFFSTVMFLLGGYVYLHHIGLHRSRLLLAIFIGATAVISLGGAMSVVVLLPFLYLVIAVGVGYMLNKWYEKFPRNPIAQGIGVTALCAVILLAVGYHTRLYFVAWPQSTATQSVYTKQEPR